MTALTLVVDVEIRSIFVHFKIIPAIILITTDAGLVDSFKDHFVSVFTAEDTSSMPACASNSVLLEKKSFSDIIFTLDDVSKVLLKLRADEAAAPDDLM